MQNIPHHPRAENLPRTASHPAQTGTLTEAEIRQIVQDVLG
ncbi:hypothetical protein [Pararoseomonas baculiformis]|nr:hypothetical protein [Pararoseomonas baculiformis]